MRNHHDPEVAGIIEGGFHAWLGGNTRVLSNAYSKKRFHFELSDGPVIWDLRCGDTEVVVFYPAIASKKRYSPN
jgi:hypothetical protein